MDGVEIQNKDYISREKLKAEGYTFVLEQIAWWNKKHIEQSVGEHRDHTYQFGYDEFGKYHQEIEVEVLHKVRFDVILKMNYKNID